MDQNQTSNLSVYRTTPKPLSYTSQGHLASCLGMIRYFIFILFLKILFIFIFREKGSRGKTGRETSIGCLSQIPNWGPGPNPDMCPDWELKQRPLGLQEEAHPTEPPQSGLIRDFRPRLLIPLSYCDASKECFLAFSLFLSILPFLLYFILSILELF